MENKIVRQDGKINDRNDTEIIHKNGNKWVKYRPKEQNGR